MGRHHLSAPDRDRRIRDTTVTFRSQSSGRSGRHRVQAARETHTTVWASAVATGTLLTVGSQFASPAVAGAHPTQVNNDVHAAAPLPADMAALTALPEVDAALDQLAAAQHLLPTLPTPDPTPAPEASQVPTPQPAPDPAPSPAPAPAAPWNVPPLAVMAPPTSPRPLAVAPVSGTLTSPFGPRWGTTHAGLDIANNIGTPVYAAAAGTVINSGPASGFGLWVQIRHDDGSTTTYGHINETLVAVGQQVQAGEQIATVGNRGQSTGPHLHFETTDSNGMKVDPIQWLAARGVAEADLARV